MQSGDQFHVLRCDKDTLKLNLMKKTEKRKNCQQFIILERSTTVQL